MTTAPHDDGRLDGNAAAGLLHTIFPFDMTTALARCAGCGGVKEVGALAVYQHALAPGLVMRCPGCDAVLLRVARDGARYWLDLRGLAWLQVDDAGQARA